MHDILQEATSVDYKQARVIVVHSCGCGTIQGYLGDDTVTCLEADVQRHSGALPRMLDLTASLLKAAFIGLSVT